MVVGVGQEALNELPSTPAKRVSVLVGEWGSLKLVSWGWLGMLRRRGWMERSSK